MTDSTGGGFVPHSSHWGSFEARRIEGGHRIEIRPAPGDPDPSPLLTAMPDMLTHPARIRQPMVRRSWLNGDRAASRKTRGTDDFVPVDWDTALDLVAGQLDLVRRENGNQAIFGGSYGWSSAGRFHHAKSQLQRFLNSIGGFTDQVQNYSYAAAITLLPRILGDYEAIQGPVSSLDGLADNCRLMICFGGISPGNMQVEAGGQGVHSGFEWLRKCARAGMRLVNVGPVDHELPAGVSAEWIPIRPNTDTVVMLAMAQVLFAEDLHDARFLDRCCVGAEVFRGYVMGESDGVPKTPEWAERISGVPAATIAQLARDAAASRSFINVYWALQRADHGEQPIWAAIALAATLGQIGLPGGGFAFGLWSVNGLGNPRRPVSSPRLPVGTNRTRSFIPVARTSDMLLSPGASYDFDGEVRRYPDIRLVYWCGGNPFHHHQDINRLVRAFQQPETVIVQEIWWTSTARHADIVLPATTTMERNDIGGSGRDRHILAMKQVVPPFGQARSDFDIFVALSRRLGVEDAFTEGRDEMAWLRHMYDISRQAAARQEVELPSFESFWDSGHFEVPPPERPYHMFADFRADPDAHPLATPSGRIEIHSETIAGFGYDDCHGHPVWIEPAEWLGASTARSDDLHLISLQPATRLHSQLDPAGASAASKIAGREPAWIHPADAAARGIEAGDVIRVFNGRGAVLAGALVTERVMPGVLVLATGAWYDPEIRGRIGVLDKHGNPNVLTIDRGSSKLAQAPISHTTLVRCERYTEALPQISAFTPPLSQERDDEPSRTKRSGGRP